MAKGARASTIKENRRKLKDKVFGPVETARTARLHAKLMEIIAQPKPERPKKDVAMEAEEVTPAANKVEPAVEGQQTEEMEVDQATSTSTKSKRSGRGNIAKKRVSRKAAIVFPSFKNGKKVSKSRSRK